MRAQLWSLSLILIAGCVEPRDHGGRAARTAGTAPTTGTPSGTGTGTAGTTGGTATGASTGGPVDDGGLDYICSRVFTVAAGADLTVEVTEGGVPAPVLEGITVFSNLDAATVADRCATGAPFMLDELGWDATSDDTDGWIEQTPLVVAGGMLDDDVPVVLSFYQPVAMLAIVVPSATAITTSISFEAPAGALRGD